MLTFPIRSPYCILSFLTSAHPIYAQSGAHSIKDWVAAGASHFRVELVDESQEDTELVVSGYLELLSGEIKANSLWESLEDVRDSNGRTAGISFGSFRNGAERRAGEIV